MLGTAIIDKLMSANYPVIMKYPNIDKQWLVASSFHDVAYPLELYDNWAKEFFKQSLDIQDAGVSDIKSYFVDKSMLSSVGFIINELCRRHFNDPLKGNWLYDEKKLLLFFYDRTTRHKHHSILSSIFLLKQAQVHAKEDLEDIFVPSALAIALHHCDYVFEKFTQRIQPGKISQNRKPKIIDFSTDPLTFILMFCDCAHEWGRPKISIDLVGSELQDERTFELDACNITGGGCFIRILSEKLKSTERLFTHKNDELLRYKKILRCPTDLRFEIVLVDNKGEKSEHIFECAT